MNTNRTIYSFGIALLIAAAIRPVYAENNDMTQSRTQDHLRTQVNLQAPANEFGQASNSEQNMVINKNQNQNQYQHQYKYMNNLSAEQSGSGKGSGSAASGSTNRYNTMNSYSQNNGAGSMSRHSSPARSSGGGGGRR